VSLALLGLAFIACAVLVAGLPPLSGFVAKVTLMSALSRSAELGLSNAPAAAIWWLFGLLLVSGLAATVSLARAGIRHFWTPADRPRPHLRVAEGVPVLALIVVCTGLTVRAEPVLRYTNAAAEALYAPTTYIDAVLSTKPGPRPRLPRPNDVEAPAP
jgi:multicomponent K+:H+ antiporter subunit D